MVRTVPVCGNCFSFSTIENVLKKGLTEIILELSPYNHHTGL